MGDLLAKLGERAPLLGDLKAIKGRLWEWASLFMGAVGQLGVGSSTRNFEIWLKGALVVECLSLWELCEGNLDGGLLCWGPSRIGRKGSGGSIYSQGPLG
jgi:hypothetical protein